MRISIHGDLVGNQSVSEVLVLGTAYSDADLRHPTSQSIWVNSNATTDTANWWVIVAGGHSFQPPGSAKCMDVEVMQGFLGLECNASY